MTTDERRRRWYRGARVGILPKTPRRAAGPPPGSAVLPAAVGAAVAGIPVPVIPPRADGGRLDRLAKCQKIKPFQAGDEDLLCANDMISLLPTRNGLVHNPVEIRRLREAATGWPK